ncbi:tRNA pseudouridine(38-40) synthase TruA [Halocynthiibacter namhaensis]|uniref:tRNA pseudouridine(38-40) synthase TruA n=1 Tax=Halocynthiibacter namhaensis TaxID=1290553 RepID=UPI0005793ACD|nr:tRNA pseudouridine(38-40) synthase TruA [Halocynthiibacter namhaensis]
MTKYALKIEYDGKPFNGWQRQAGHPSVQQTIEQALGKLEDNVPSIVTAGRTDTGVHALGQVAHCVLQKAWTPFKLCGALNFHLKPNPIAITDVVAVPDDFSARFWAVERQYIFRILNRRAPATANRGQVWQVPYHLDVDAMREAAQYMLGTHDFTAFRSAMCQGKSPIKTMDEARIEEVQTFEGRELQCHFRARSFLHNQIRSIVGTLERVGSGHWAPERFKDVLDSRDRHKCGPVAAPQGLYLSKVKYEIDPFDTAITAANEQ